jgi:hypothetical protein
MVDAEISKLTFERSFLPIHLGSDGVQMHFSLSRRGDVEVVGTPSGKRYVRFLHASVGADMGSGLGSLKCLFSGRGFVFEDVS